MTSREPDALMAELFFDWRWVIDPADHRFDRLLPPGLALDEVAYHDWIPLDSKAGRFRFAHKSLPGFSVSLDGARPLLTIFRWSQLTWDGNHWTCKVMPVGQGEKDPPKVQEVEATDKSEALAICRAMYKAATARRKRAIR